MVLTRVLQHLSYGFSPRCCWEWSSGFHTCYSTMQLSPTVQVCVCVCARVCKVCSPVCIMYIDLLLHTLLRGHRRYHFLHHSLNTRSLTKPELGEHPENPNLSPVCVSILLETTTVHIFFMEFWGFKLIYKVLCLWG